MSELHRHASQVDWKILNSFWRKACLCYLHDEFGVFLPRGLSMLRFQLPLFFIPKWNWADSKNMRGENNFNFTRWKRQRLQAGFAAGEHGPSGMLFCRLWTTMQRCVPVLQQHTLWISTAAGSLSCDALFGKPSHIYSPCTLHYNVWQTMSYVTVNFAIHSFILHHR